MTKPVKYLHKTELSCCMREEYMTGHIGLDKICESCRFLGKSEDKRSHQIK